MGNGHERAKQGLSAKDTKNILQNYSKKALK